MKRKNCKVGHSGGIFGKRLWGRFVPEGRTAYVVQTQLKCGPVKCNIINLPMFPDNVPTTKVGNKDHSRTFTPGVSPMSSTEHTLADVFIFSLHSVDGSIT